MDFERPYFMTNSDWYAYDIENYRYKLTDKAPKEAIDSYNEFYSDPFNLYGCVLADPEDF